MQNAPVTIWLWCELIEYRVYSVFTLDTTLYLPWVLGTPEMLHQKVALGKELVDHV